MDFLIIGNGMFGAATARYLAPYATVTVVGREARTDGSREYGAHHDEGRIIGDLSRDIAWSELNRRARDGMTELDPTLITPRGALTVTTRDSPGHPGYLGVAAELRQRGDADIRILTADAARSGFPMTRFGPDETILHQPARPQACDNPGARLVAGPRRREVARVRLLARLRRVRGWRAAGVA